MVDGFGGSLWCEVCFGDFRRGILLYHVVDIFSQDFRPRDGVKIDSNLSGVKGRASANKTSTV